MSPGRRAARLALALAAAGGLAAACARPEAAEAPAPWQRLDLAAATHRVERESGARREVLVEPAARGLVRPVPGQPWWSPEVVTVRQAAGSRIAWTADLGGEPYLAVRPLGTQRAGCRGAMTVSVRDAAGATEELLREPLRLPGRDAPAERELDLGRWAGARVEVVFAVEAAAGAPARRWRPCRGIWGAPAVYSRRPAASPVPEPSAERPPNVLLLGLDTFRADHWTSRPPERPSFTPALDRLAAESDVWLDAYSTFNNTNPSFISIHTGLYGRRHGIYDLVTPLPDEHRTMAERFRDAGYATYAAVSALHLLRASGLGQGFDRFEGPTRSTAAASWVADRGIEWIAEAPQPFFAWLHFFDVHVPTLPPAPYAYGLRAAAPSGLAPVRAWTAFRPLGRRDFLPGVAGHPDLYAGAAAAIDRQVDRLLGALASRGLLANTFVVVVADHGESLGEHGLLHDHFGLFEPSVHVPLVVRWPDGATPRGGEPGAPRGRRLRGLVQTVDLLPSLLAATGLASPAAAAADTAGRDLWELTLPALGGEGAGRAAVVAEHANRQGAMIRAGRYKYVWMEDDNPKLPAGASLYDLAADPGETVDLAGRGLAVERRLAAALAAWRAGAAAAPARTPAREEVESLRALGYLR